MHYSNSESLLASPASSVPALQHFAIFDSPSWFRPVVAPIGSGCISAFSRRFFAAPALDVAPVWGLLWKGAGESEPGSPNHARLQSGRSPPWGVEMATEPENRSLGARRRRLLTVLAKAPRGRDVNALLSRGFRFETIADLIRNGLATVQLQSMGKREPNVHLACVRMTDAGRRALKGAAESE
jgi:hypothetical protein